MGEVPVVRGGGHYSPIVKRCPRLQRQGGNKTPVPQWHCDCHSYCTSHVGQQWPGSAWSLRPTSTPASLVIADGEQEVMRAVPSGWLLSGGQSHV